MTKAAQFWQWFVENERRFRDVEVADKDQLLDEIQHALHRISEDLWFEIGGDREGPQELVITAEGKHHAFALVREVVSAAPEIPGWKIIAFKPPRGFDFTTSYGDITVSPKAAWFSVLPAPEGPDGIDLRVAYADFEPSKAEAFLTATYHLLEGGLGELAVAQIFRSIEVCAAPPDPRAEGQRLLSELPGYIAKRGYTISG